VPESFKFIVNEQEVNSDPKTGAIKQMFSDKLIKHNLLASCMLWLMSAFNFYLITFYLKYFPGNIFQSSMVFAISDMVAFFLSGTILKYVKVGRALRLSFAVSWVGGFLYMYLD
jgi:hypothetical protein